MSACRCSERQQPLPTDLGSGSNARPRQWFVLTRNESRSAFNGYRTMWSDYSLVACRVCGHQWRTKSRFVSALPNCEYWPHRRAPHVDQVQA